MQSTQNIKPLFLSFWTPPAVRPRANAAGKIIPELMRQGVFPIVMTYKICGDWNIDLPVYKISELRKRGRFIGILDEFLYYLRLFNTARAIIKKHGVNIVFSYSNPQESNVLGAMLKKFLGIPFVSHFSDPWVDNPYKKFSGLGGFKARMLEKFVIKNSDRIMFTNQAALELIMKKYPASWTKKASVLNHSFDFREYPHGFIGDRVKYVISHVGAFYKERTPETLFMALKKISNENPEIFKKLEVVLVGAGNEYGGYGAQKINELINKYGLTQMVKITPIVEYKESLKLMKESDCLVVIDAPFEKSPFFPSKTVEYAGSGKPILGITPFGSPTSEFLEKLGFWHFEHNQVEEISKCILDLVLGKKGFSPNKEFLSGFSVEAVSAELIRELRECALLK